MRSRRPETSARSPATSISAGCAAGSAGGASALMRTPCSLLAAQASRSSGAMRQAPRLSLIPFSSPAFSARLIVHRDTPRRAAACAGERCALIERTLCSLHPSRQSGSGRDSLRRLGQACRLAELAARFRYIPRQANRFPIRRPRDVPQQLRHQLIAKVRTAVEELIESSAEDNLPPGVRLPCLLAFEGFHPLQLVPELVDSILPRRHADPPRNAPFLRR